MKLIILMVLLVSVSVFPRNAAKAREPTLVELMKAYKANKNKKGLAEKIGTIHFKTKSYEKALPFLKEAASKDPNKAELHRMLGVIYVSAMEDSLAVVHYLRVLEINPYQHEVSSATGRIFEEKKKFSEAGQFYDMAVEAQPKNAEYVHRAGYCYFRAGEFPAAKQKLLKAAALNPRLPEAHYMLGRILLNQDEPEAAVKEFNKALKLKPDQTDYLGGAAEAAFLSGNTASAVKFYQRYLRKKSDDCEARANFGRCQLKLRNTQAALAEFDRVLKCKAQLIEDDFGIGRTYYVARKFPQAKRILLNVLRTHPENAEAQVMAAVILESEKDTAGAIGHYEEAAKTDKGRFALYRKIGDFRLRQGKEDKAVSAYEAYLTAKKDPAIAKKLLDIYRRLSRPEDVRRMLAIITSASPGDVANLMALADMDSASGDAQAALESYLKVLKKNPAHPEASYLAGVIYLDRKSYKDADLWLGRALKADPASVRAALALGRLKQETGKLDEAGRYYGRVFAADPKNGAVLDNLIALYRKMGRKGELKDALLKKTTLNPKAGDAWAELGRLYTESGHSQAAEIAYRRAIEISGECLDCYLALARMYRALRRPSDAVAFYKKAVYVDWKDPEVFYELGRVCLDTRDSTGALDAFEKALALKQDHAGAIEALSGLYTARKDQKKAIAMFQEMAKKKPRDAGLHRALARAYLDTRDFARAEVELKAAQELDPKSAETSLNLGIFYQERNAPDKALEYFSLAYERSPGNRGISGRYADALYGRQQFAKAVSVYLRRLKEDRKDTVAMARLLSCYLALGDSPKAMGAAGLLEKADPERAKRDYNVARACYRTGKKERAFSILEAGGVRDDKEYFEMMGALYKERKQYAPAAEALRQLFERDKGNLKTGFELGGIYEEQGQDGLAEEIYKSLEVAFPRDPEVKKRLLSVYRKQSRAQETRAVLMELVRLEPGNADALTELSVILAAEGQKKKAAACLAAALKAEPSHPQASLLYGRWLMEGRNYAAAEGYLAVAAAALKDDPAVILALGLLNSAQGNPGKALPYLEKAHILDPGDTTVADALAGAYKTLNQTDKLALLYQEMIRANAKSSAARRGLGDLYFRQGRNREAMTEYAFVIESGVKDTALFNRQGVLLLKAGDVAGSIGMCQRSLALAAGQPDIAYALGTIFLEKRGDEASAKAQFEAVVRLDPARTGACRKLGRLYQQDGDSASAIRCYVNTLRASPNDPGVLADLARLLLNRDNFAKSEALIRKAVRANPDDVDMKLSLARKYLELRRPGDAEPLLAGVYAARPDDVKVMTDLVGVYNSLGQSGKAVPILDKLLASGLADAEIQMQLGIAYYGQQQYGKAREVLEKVLSKVNGTPEAATTLGLIFIRENDPRKAKLALDKAVEIDPAYGPAYLATGNLLYGQNDFTGAQIPLARAIELMPDNDEPSYMNLLCLIRLKQTDLALAQGKLALQRFQRSDRICFALASAFIMASQYEKALKTLDLAEQINPSYKDAFKLSGDICVDYLRNIAAGVEYYRKYLAAGGTLDGVPSSLRGMLR